MLRYVYAAVAAALLGSQADAQIVYTDGYYYPATHYTTGYYSPYYTSGYYSPYSSWGSGYFNSPTWTSGYYSPYSWSGYNSGYYSPFSSSWTYPAYSGYYVNGRRGFRRW